MANAGSSVTGRSESRLKSAGRLIRARWRRTKGGARQSPGVILIQVDGLSRFQFERAVKAGRMPFLKSLLRGGRYRLCSFYSGQPSTTPAVQAEIMYGKRCAVPAFSFYDADRDEDYRMYDADWAQRIAELASREAAPLLEEGSSYANIYTGGAARAAYCGEVNTFGHWLHEVSIFRLLPLAFRYPKSAVKVLWLCLIEVFLALHDFVRGIIDRGDVWEELKLVGSRVGAGIALREAIRFRVRSDIKDGMPIIYANFFGYDEQAHRRGPQSLFAHWSLKGIDGTIKKIWRAARKRGPRDYEVLVFSDHGQEAVVPYWEEVGVSLEERTEQLFRDEGFRVKPSDALAGFMERAKYTVANAIGLEGDQPDALKRWIRVKAMGPVGHIYVEEGLSEQEKRVWARRYIREGGISIALFQDVLGDPCCLFEDREGGLDLVREALENRGHSFAEEVTADLELLVKSGLSGDLILLGWRPNQKPMSFAEERGAHAGPGAEETRGFVLVPRSCDKRQEWIRGLDLRQMALALAGRCPIETPPVRKHPFDPSERVLQMATYNVHGGVGTDRRFDPDRIARLVSDLHVKVVCFQEAFCSVDGRYSLEDSLRRHWREDLYYDFLPLHERGGIRYGLAIASTSPMKVTKAAAFQLTHPAFAKREPRGAQLVALEVAGRRVYVANTHFGLNAAERLAQSMALLDKSWLGDGVMDSPAALAGDFNAGPNSPAIQLLRGGFRDAQESIRDRRAQASFISWAPVRRIDHILASQQWEVKGAGVFRGRNARVASDHLPVFADLRLRDPEESLS